MPAARTLAAPFKMLELQDARRIIAVAMSNLAMRANQFGVDLTTGSGIAGIADTYALNPILVSRAFLLGDHWQRGHGWIGPRPQATDAAYLETMTEIARAFISKNVIAEVVYRHMNGVVGIEPHFGLTMKEERADDEEIPPEIQTLIDEGEALLTTWWDERKMHEMLQQAVITLLYAERAALRLYIPRGMLVDEPVLDDFGAATGEVMKVIEAGDVEDALIQIYADHPLPEASAVVQDPDTKEYVGVVMYRIGQSVTGQGTTQEGAEITYLDGDRDKPLTVIRVTGANGTRSYANDWGGVLPMFEMRRPLFVTPQMWQGQKALNLALSMIPRGNITAGFLERTIINAQMPGEWITDTNGRRIGFKPGTYNTGAGTTNFLQGIEITDAESGKTTLSTPQVDRGAPIAATGLIESERSHYADLLEEASQEHTLAYTNTHASGKTHEQARADFTTSLRMTQSRVEAMGRWLITALLSMAESMGGEEGRFTDKLRPYFSLRVDTGPITSQERVANDASVKAGTLSVESAIVRNGETDPDAELQKLAKEPGHGLAVIERQVAAIGTLVFQAGATLEGAAEFVGVDPAIVKKLVGDGTEQPPKPDPNAPPVVQ